MTESPKRAGVIAIARWRIGLLIVAGFVAGIVVRVGDPIVIGAMVTGMAAAGACGWWLRDVEGEPVDPEMARVAMFAAGGVVPAGVVARLRQTHGGAGGAPELGGERHPIVTRPDDDTDQALPWEYRRSPRR